MNAHDDWASYLDPETGAEERERLASDMPAGGVAALGRVADGLADPAMWDGPSPDLRSRLLAQAGSEIAAGSADTGTGTGAQPGVEPGAVGADTGSGAGTDGPTLRAIDGGAEGRPTGRRGRGAGSRFGQGVLTGGLVAAAAAVILFVAIGLPDDGPGGDITTFEVAGTELTPDLNTTVDVEPLPAGVAITLNIKGLAGAGPGQYYAAWVMGDNGVVGVGSFHWREGGVPIELWSGVDTEAYPMFTVTLQTEGDPPTPSDVVVMRANLSEGG